MKRKLLVLLFAFISFSLTVNAQSVDEIIGNYLENTGGADNWKKLEGIKTTAKFNMQGQELPMEMLALKDGKTRLKFEFQGKEIIQNCFDGKILWGTNFMTMKAEKSDNEATENAKRTSKFDFPDPFLDYKSKGYAVELMGKESIEGTECFKIKLTKAKQLVEGKEEENITYYYFDSEDFVPIMTESEIKTGQMKGKTQQMVFSDYQEVDGLYFPFAITQKIKDLGGQTFNIENIELNPKVEAKSFTFPEE